MATLGEITVNLDVRHGEALEALREIIELAAAYVAKNPWEGSSVLSKIGARAAKAVDSITASTVEQVVCPDKVNVRVGSLEVRSLGDGRTEILMDGQPVRNVQEITLSCKVDSPWMVQYTCVVPPAPRANSGHPNVSAVG